MATIRDLTDRLGSLRLTIFLILGLALAASLGTILPQGQGIDRYSELLGPLGAAAVRFLGLGDLYHAAWFRGLLILLSVNMLFCMWGRVPAMLSSLRGEAALRRTPVREAPWSEAAQASLVGELKAQGYRVKSNSPHLLLSKHGSAYAFTLLSHGSLILIMIFAVAGSALGFIGTKRLYVGDSVGDYFDWSVMADRPLPFEVRVEDFTAVPNPVALKLGVLETASGRKGKVLRTHVGGRIRVPGLAGVVLLQSFDLERKVLGGLWIGPEGEIPFVSGQPIGKSGLELVPVAFATWPEKQVLARTVLVRGGRVLAEQDVAVNSPMAYGGIDIFITDYGQDGYGFPYVGFQFVSDPGRAGLWAGCVMFLVSVTGAIFLRHRCVVLVRQDGVLRAHLSARGPRDLAERELEQAWERALGSGP